ncbi:uncharacterized protein LOC111880951 [Lactuca sativa]|uniref:Protein kinase domain-containing protein n=1 Tax=Lactuca sativa TaxID=4236 RepID=A0A9R1VG98_LACSA|nr:uncharacterized protein LOC111880951 [Lactuca sativa]KAJ0206632.1 hypothetical protein LSAT_V11C500238520 [Lactuca sativa]
MFTTKERDRTKIFIVVLDGPKVLREKSGVAPLSYTLRQVVQPDDEVVVLVIFNSGDLTQTPVISSCCIRTEGRNHQPNNKRDIFITKLREEISQGTEGYMRIFRPFHRECKNIGVKFEAKIVIGPTLTAIISEEKLNTGATSVVIGSEDEEMILYTCNPSGESSGVKNEGYRDQKPSKYKKKQSSNNEVKPIYHILPNFEGIYQPSSSSSSIGSTSEPQQETEDFEKFKDHFVEISNIASSSRGLEFLVELSWEVISEITDRFKNIINVSSNEAFQVYSGYFEDRSSAVFVKRFVGTHFNYVLEAEKKAALSMYHKNIVRLLGFHQNENAMALVFPYASRGLLMDRFLNGFWTKELEIHFADKMKIAIGIAQGLRYMHEQCPRGPIVHGDLRACNVLLGHNLEPQARPLLAQRAYHILYDESEHDFHGLLVVTTAAIRCISTRWNSSPCMSQVLSLLKGDISCAEQTFPSTESSPAATLSPDSNVWLRSNENSSIMALTPDSNLWVV